jgi:hypothetical protein
MIISPFDGVGARDGARLGVVELTAQSHHLREIMGGHRGSSEVIGRSLEVIGGSSGVIGGHRRSSEIIGGHRWDLTCALAASAAASLAWRAWEATSGAALAPARAAARDVRSRSAAAT